METEEERLSRIISAYEQANALAAEGNYQEAYELCREALEPRDPVQQHDWGIVYHNGIGVPQNMEKAYSWLMKAYQQGDPESAYALGCMYYIGKCGEEKDYQRAFEYWSEAAESENAKAQNNLGLMYFNGEYVDKNTESAYMWYSRAAENGNISSKVNLSIGCYRGKYLRHSYEKAWEYLEEFDVNEPCSELYERSISEDYYSNANCILGMMHLFGKGRERNYHKALNCLTYAAEHGDNEAQFWLGFMYARGLGTDFSAEDGEKWFRASADAGYEDAVALLASKSRREFLDRIWKKEKWEAEE